MSQKTPREIVTFLNVAGSWIEKHEPETKFKYALRKVAKHCQQLFVAYQEQAEDLDIEHCSVDAKGNILRDNGALVYTKDALKKRNAERNRLFDAPVTVTPHYAKPPADLTAVERDAFAGFVLEPVDDVEPADDAA